MAMIGSLLTFRSPQLPRPTSNQVPLPVCVVLGSSREIEVTFEEGSGLAKPIRMEAKRVKRTVREDVIEQALGGR